MVFNLGDPTTLEACAIREGFSLAVDLNLDMICMASDCKGVVQEIKKGSAATYGAIVFFESKAKLHYLTVMRHIAHSTLAHSGWYIRFPL